MSHIDHEVRAIISVKRNEIIKLYRLNYFINSFKINDSTICTCSCKNQLGLIISDFVFEVFVIDKSIFVYVVKFNIVEFAAKINRTTMSQMTAIVKAHCKNSIAGVKNCGISTSICLRARMRLNIYMIICVEYFSPKIATIFFNFIHYFTTAIISTLIARVSFCGITFGVFICKTTSHCFKYHGTYKIFTCNKLYIFTLATSFFFYEFFNYFVQFSCSFLSANKASMISMASVATNLSYSLLP